MDILYTGEELPEDYDPNKGSIFLAGPSPRQSGIISWRAKAYEILKDKFNGVVFNPEWKDPNSTVFNYTNQVEWEWKYLHLAKSVVFWVPRELKDFPAFTTNVEFGFYIDKTNVIYGRPDDAPKNRYLDWLYQKVTGKIPFNSLEDTLLEAIK